MFMISILYTDVMYVLNSGDKMLRVNFLYCLYAWENVESAWYIISVVFVCLYIVCMYVCQTITFESLDV